MRFALVLFVSASISMPMAFFAGGLPALMREVGVRLDLIGLTSLVYLPLALVFLWAPIIDRRAVLSGLGRRRCWLIVTQILIVVVLAASASLSPKNGFVPILVMAVTVSFLAATQRTALLGFAVENFSGVERPWCGALLPAGGAVGALIGASGLLFLFDRLGWSAVMLIVAALSAVFLAPVFLTSEHRSDANPAVRAQPSLRRFFRLVANWRVISFIAPLSLGLGLGFGMLQPQLVDLGFSLKQIGLLNGLFACSALLTGGPVSAFLISRFGLAPVLPAGVCAIAVVFFYASGTAHWQFGAIHGAVSLVLFFLAFSFLSVMTNTIFMGQSEAGQEATDFTIFVGIYSLISMVGMGLAGVLAEHFGYATAFLAGAVLVTGSLALIRPLRLDGHAIPLAHPSP